MIKIVMVLVLGLQTEAFAQGGSGMGNGGDVVVCRDDGGQIQSVQFLDLYEAPFLYERVPALGAAELSVNEKIALIAGRMVYFPNLTKELIDHANTFESKIEWSEKPLEDIPDSGDLVFPSGCKVEQLIIRRKDADKPFLVDQSLWEKLDNDSKAAGIVHEFLYGLAVDLYKHKNSVFSRRLNAEFLSVGPSEPGALLSWVELFQSLKFGFQESWGCLDSVGSTCPYERQVKFNDYNPYRDQVTMDGENLSQLSLPSSSHGVFDLGPGRFSISRVIRTGEVYIEGNLSRPKLFHTPYGTFLARGPVRTWPSQVLVEDGAEISFSQLQNEGTIIQIKEECWSKASGTFDLNLSYPSFSIAILQRDRNCDLRLQSSFKNIVFTQSEGFSVRSSGVGSLSLLIGMGHLSWDYGSFELKETASIEYSNNSYRKYFEVLASESIGYWPEIKIGESTFKNLAFQDLTTSFPELFQSPVDDISFTPTEVNFLPRAGLALTGLIQNFSNGIYTVAVQGEFHIEKIDGFHSSYIGLPVRKVEYSKLNTHRIEMGIDRVPRVYGRVMEWIKSATIDGKPMKIEEIFPSKSTPLFKFGLTSTGSLDFIPGTECAKYLFWEGRIETTPKGKRYTGYSTIYPHEFVTGGWMSSHFSGCLTKSGLDLNDLEVEVQ